MSWERVAGGVRTSSANSCIHITLPSQSPLPPAPGSLREVEGTLSPTPPPRFVAATHPLFPVPACDLAPSGNQGCVTNRAAGRHLWGHQLGPSALPVFLSTALFRHLSGDQEPLPPLLECTLAWGYCLLTCSTMTI